MHSGTQYDALLARPTREGMLALGWGAFERFVARVFERAGYRVEYVALRLGSGADLALHSASKETGEPAALVSVKHVRPPNVVAPAEVRAFGVALGAAGLPGYLVSVTELTPEARAEAAAHAGLRLLAGEEWVRYVEHVARDGEGDIRA